MPDQNELTPDESNLLLAAMAQAQLDGDEDTIEKLAEMASDPAAVREAVAGVGGEETPPPEKKSAPKRPEVPRLKTLPPVLFGVKSLNPGLAGKVRQTVERSRRAGAVSPAERTALLDELRKLPLPDLQTVLTEAIGYRWKKPKGELLRAVESRLTATERALAENEI